MVISNGYLMIFALAMMGCVLATPLVTQIATWVGAIDRPDQFRRIHQGAIPRLGGLGLALGIAAGTVLPHLSGSSRFISLILPDLRHEWVILSAVLIVLVVGFVDDTRSIGPRVKLIGQALAVLILYIGGIQIQTIDVLGLNLDLTNPTLHISLLGFAVNLAIPSLAVTLLWFLGCMNIWNLIDGMDGLASGVGLLVSGTLTLVAIHNENIEVAILAIALAGSLAGFLLYNWHPACIFLGDSGALLIGLLIGVIGVEGSMKGPSAISILFPILAMGLPISDTAMAIFRRWVRNLPLSAADRRHVHHLLIGLGLNPRQAALMLYCFSGFLCGAVLLGVALRSEFLALVLGLFGCLAFLVVVTSRRDELTNLRGDLQERMLRGRQERIAAKLTWEAIQRIELCDSATASFEIVERTAQLLGCQFIQISCTNGASPLISTAMGEIRGLATPARQLSESEVIFRLSSGEGLWLTVWVELNRDLELATDIVFRYLQRLGLALAGRLAWLQSMESNPSPGVSRVEEICVTTPPGAIISTSVAEEQGIIGAISRVLRMRPRVLQASNQPAAQQFPTVKAVGTPTGLARR
jgi:UDP-GlcNAc:undecaprenyl-phosphate/decaprenyl-phosphate GlcNAc-1-phosphate transferase